MDTPEERFVLAWLTDHPHVLVEIMEAYSRTHEPRSFDSTFVDDLKKANGCDS